MATITKRDLVVEISNKTGFTQQKVIEVIQSAIDSMTEHLAEGDEVVLRNFGTFHITVTKAKIGRNPKQPEKDVEIPARAVVKFKVGKELKEKVSALLPKLQN